MSCGRTGPRPCQCKKIDVQPKANSIAFDRDYRTGYVGYSESIYVTTSESYTMISSDETIVSLDWDADSNHYWLNFNKTGTSILTATTVSGQTAQCTVEVKEMQHIALNDSITVTLQPNDRATYIFDYTSYGEYVLFSTDTNTEAWLAYSTKDTPQTSFSRNKSYITLSEESEFCHLTLLNKYSTPQQFSVCLMEAVPVSSMTIHITEYYNGGEDIWYPGDHANLSIETHPVNARYELISLSFSDASVASEVCGRLWDVSMKTAGATTLTATSESGAVAEYPITVLEPVPIQSAHVTETTLTPTQRIQYCFTPTESGQYGFYVNEWNGENLRSCMDITLASHDESILLQEYNHDTYHVLLLQMEAGETYTFQVRHSDFVEIDGKHHTEHEMPLRVLIHKISPIRSISFNSEATDYWKFENGYGTGYASNVGRISIDCPIGTAPDTFTWNSSDESVVTINTTSYDPPDDAFIAADVGLIFHNPGTARITVMSENGLSTTFDVTVLEYTEYSTNYGRSAKWAKSSNSDFSIEIAAPVEKFLNLVCYQSVPDAEYYSIATGSSEDTTLITFKNDFLQTLPSGYCVMYFNFSDGYAYFVLNVLDSQFTDVPAGSFYEAPVLWAVDQGITNGLSDTEFGPTATCNRAQVVTFLWRAAGCPEPASTENPFVDVQSGSFYEKPVLWAVENGITNGADATHFDPTGVCNRAQVVTFLYRAFGSPAVSTEGLPFTDVPAGAWYEAPIAWAVENGITNGLTATEFGPNASCNRAQVVTFLYRAYN